MREQIAAGIINQGGKFLITKRLPNEHLGGYWEFPGGKLQETESLEQCVQREIKEELGLEIKVKAKIGTWSYSYPDRDCELSFFLCDVLEGEPKSKRGQEWRWIDRLDLSKYKFPPANTELIKILITQHKVVSS